MQILINNPIQATWIFSLLFFIVLLVFVRPRKIMEWFPTSVTTELKGLAILMIVLSHIGYFLATDTRFLWPLSIMAGVGVNLFLFLSGFGLTASQMQKNLSVTQFYKKRLLKLFSPFWLSLIIFLLLDFFILKISYSWDYIGRAFIGIFTHADVSQDINSPLWYFTFIFGYYLLFPLLFFKKKPWLTALFLYLVGYLVIYYKPAPLDYVLHLYKLHIFAFPLGVLAAWAVTKLKSPVILEKLAHGWRAIGYYLVIVGLLVLFLYANINSGIGESANKEQLMSILAVVAICLIFVLKKIEFRLFYWFGIYSYEIYLWHWPIMYRFDIFYLFVPAWLATLLYLGFFILLSWGAGRLTDLITRKKTRPVLLVPPK